MIRFVATTSKLIVFVVIGGLLISALLGDSPLRPDVMLIGLAILALAEGPLAGAVGGFVLGLVLDSSVPNLLGLNALTKTLFGYGLGVYRTRMVRGLPLAEGLTIAAFALAHDVLSLIIASGSLQIDLVHAILLESVPSALLTGLLAVPMFRLAEFTGVMHRDS